MKTIYEITTKDGLRYVGRTADLNKRIWEHKTGRHSPLEKGDFESYRVLDEVEGEFTAYLGECYYILLLKPELNQNLPGIAEKKFNIDELKEMVPSVIIPDEINE